MKTILFWTGFNVTFIALVAWACTPKPYQTAKVASDAYNALLVACDYYDALPESEHTHEADMACADIRDVCVP